MISVVCSVFIKTLGCKVNRVESDLLQAALVKNGFDCIQDVAGADIVVVNTCTVTAESDAKVRKAIRQALTGAPNASVVVTGCGTHNSANDFARLSDRVIVASDKEGLLSLCLALRGDRSSAVPVQATDTKQEVETDLTVLPIGKTYHTRGVIKIQDGCDNYCAYCIICRVRGPEKSETPEKILALATAFESSGVPEIVLTGINLGRYRAEDRHGDTVDLAMLLARLRQATTIRFRLSSIEPQEVTPRVLESLSQANGALHLHIPLQSGSDKVLRDMGRRYSSDEYRSVVEAARSALPGVALTTDVIVGFPGESDADFDQTLRFCREMGFAKIHVFRFSARAGTPAAEREDRVSEQKIARRARELRELSEALRASFIQEHRDRELEVAVERIVEDPHAAGSWCAEGTSSEYLHVRFLCGPEVKVGHMVTVSGPRELV